MSKKISQLPAAANAIDTDQHEVNKAGVSQRLTNGQIAAFMETALSKLVLTGGGNVSLNADGSASFAGAALTISPAGVLSVGGGNSFINPDGSASFAVGFVNFYANGIASFNGGLNVLNTDGSAGFAGGAVAIDALGNVVLDTGTLTIGGAVGITQDVVVLTALPSTFKTLHFTGGILTSVT